MKLILFVLIVFVCILICALVERLCWYKKETEDLMELCAILEKQSCDAWRKYMEIKYGKTD